MATSLPTTLWAAQVAAATLLPDARLNTRLQQLLVHFDNKPLDAIPQAMNDAHQAKATYRFLANERFDANDLLTGLKTVTTQMLRGQSVVYVAHDTTTFSYSSLKRTTGLGYISDSQTARGILCHSSLALLGNGVALGLLHQHYWVRDELPVPRPQQRPLEDKESVKWLQGVEATEAALAKLPEAERPRIIHLMDREGDIYEVLDKIVSLGHGAIIRRYQARKVEEQPGDADEAIRHAPLVARLTLKLKASHGCKARTAVVELRSRRLTLRPPGRRRHRSPGSPWTMVEVREVEVPAGVEEPIHWLLWTTEPARTKKQIVRVIAGYTLRWRVEDLHLTWKQGCRVEQLQLETCARLQKALVLYAGVAVRILRLRDLARREPLASCLEVLTEEEWQVLYVHATGESVSPSTAVPTVLEVTKWLGRLGGHLGRKGDGLPGVRTLWRGWRDLSLLVAGYRAGRLGL
jgi:hypothetical protein